MSEILKTISPVDGSVYVEREFASLAMIEKSLAMARKAQNDWQKVNLAERKAICLAFVEKFVENQSQIAAELTWQMGRPITQTPGEVRGVVERARYMIDIAEQALADLTIQSEKGVERFIRREPLGVVFVMAPWNYPYLTSINAIIPAIMAGNVVILKHSHQTPLCAERLYEAFDQAGLPEGVFQYLHLTHSATDHILQSGKIDFVAFTGSVEGGRHVQQMLKDQFIATGLELGGKDPAYVRADVDLDFAVDNVMDGAFFNAGQCCCGIERIYVQQQIVDEFVERFVERTKKYVLGNPLEQHVTLGPMVRSSSADFVRGQIDEAVKQGARALIDPALFSENKLNTPYLAPQVLINVNHTMRVMTEESFGPVVGIMSVKSDEEAIQLMNDSDFGLTASVWTNDLAAAKYIGGKIETGTFYMNRCDYLDPALVWTGVKCSGRGCSLSVLGYEQLTQAKSFYLREKI